jgi:hypothetical protein
VAGIRDAVRGARAPRHFEMYHGETLQRVLADQVGFLRAHLLSETAGRLRAG